MFRKFETSLGVVKGVTEGDVVRISRLRYAMPPIGERRFAKPFPLERWQGVQDATGVTAMAPQYPARLAAVMGDYPVQQSEDCLHLDIWIPQAGATKIPVFVFFHGGAYISGGGGMPCYDGSILAARGPMIVVNVSYRLGALGLLPIPGIVPANLTLHDQIAALRFIREEIAAFGGDRTRITVAGQSAGALSLAIFLAQPNFPDLFDQAMLLSTPLGSPLPTFEEATEAVAKPLLFSLGINPRDRAALCAVPTNRLLGAQQELMRAIAAKAPPDVLSLPFKPTIDGDVVQVQPTALVRCDRPIMMGATRDEFGAFWFGRPELPSLAKGLLTDRLKKEFPDDEGQAFLANHQTASPVSLLGELSTASTFARPMLTVLNQLAAEGGIGFSYQFDWCPSSSTVGACHCIELPFVFGNLKTWESALMLAGASREELAARCQEFQRAIITFVNTGDPGAGTGNTWPRFVNDGPVRHFPMAQHLSSNA